MLFQQRTGKIKRKVQLSLSLNVILTWLCVQHVSSTVTMAGVLRRGCSVMVEMTVVTTVMKLTAVYMFLSASATIAHFFLCLHIASTICNWWMISSVKEVDKGGWLGWSPSKCWKRPTAHWFGGPRRRTESQFRLSCHGKVPEILIKGQKMPLLLDIPMLKTF